jgi:hypothetical protein
MKGKNFLIILLIVFSAFLISACDNSVKDPRADLTKAFIGGSEGLTPAILEGMPPGLIHDDNSFPFGVGVSIENTGETDVGPGTNNPFVMVRLEGISPDQFSTTDDEIRKVLDVPLRGAERHFDGTIFPGEITTAIFEPLIFYPNIRGNTERTIRAVLCYDYETLSTTSICIKDDVLENIQDETLCSLQGEKLPQNSGAPLQVTSVVQNPMAENKIQVSFVIEHVGIGEFFGRPTSGQQDTSEICDFSVRNLNKYNVDVIVEPLSDSGMVISCSRFNGGSSGRIKLYQGAPTTVRCTIERTRASAGRVFEDLLNVKLLYRYGQFIETPIIIQDVTN